MRNDGDPIVLYDRQADRWVMSQLALENDFSGPFWQCVAVSQTGDPTGAFYRYAFKISDTKLNDYPKFGIWPDGYYLTINQFIVNCNSFNCTEQWAGQRVVAFERDKMLQGQAAQTVTFELSPTQNLGRMLPADFDGSPPPAGAPAVFAQIDDDEFDPSLIPLDRLQIWEFHVDWTTPSNSTFTQVALIPVAPFSSNLCSYNPCVPQPGFDFLGLPSPLLDTLSDRLMYRLQYRNFGAYQTLVTNHTVNVGGDRAGIRWYELRNSGSGWGIHQQGTYAPDDGLHRWVGSIAMDGAGNIALGYSLGSRTVYPSIAYVGRQASDQNPGVMTEAETIMTSGTGAQEDSSGRWGDYTSLALDPTDDCTFWYTNEYLTYTDVIYGWNWQTRIGAFRFPSCADTTPPTGSLTINSNAAYTNSTAVTLNLSASDNVGVTGYYLSTSSTPPAAGATGWFSVTATTSYRNNAAYTLSSGDGTKMVYAWYKDAAGNVSARASASILLDQTPPNNGTLTATAGNAQVSLSWTGFADGGSGLASSNPYKLVFATGGSPAASCTSGNQIFLGTDTSFIHTGLTNGITYNYRVCANDNAGNTSTGASASATLHGPATLTGLTADKAAPQPVGTTITFTATTSGGVTPYSFRWWLWDGTTWTLLRDWATGSTYAWTPTVANPNYRVGVWVRSAGATADAAESVMSIPFAITTGP